MPEASSAAEDCGSAVDDWVTQAQSSVEGISGDDGADQWQALQDKGVALAQKRGLGNKQNRTKPCLKKKHARKTSLTTVQRAN